MTATLAARMTVPAILVAYLAATFGVAHGDLYVQGLVLVAAVFAILAVSLDLAAGATGLYSLGHAGLFAIGAYSTTLLANDRGLEVFALLPISVCLSGLVGLVLGALSLRVSGLYFAITTFVFTLVISVLATDLSGVTGGLQGVIGPVFPDFPDAVSVLGRSVVWCVMLALLIAVALTWSIRRSPLYPVLLTIRDAEPFAAAAGVRTSLLKIGVFGLSAALAGLAGWAFSFLGVVSPGQFGWPVSVNILVMVILGGINTTLGPIVGAAFVSMFPAYVNINPWWQEILFGGLFVFAIVVFPQGVVGLLSAAGGRLRSGRSTGAGGPARPPSQGGAGSSANRELRLQDDGQGPLAEARVGAEAQLEGRLDGDRPAVECRDIVFRYTRGATVLDHVDLVVRPGTIHGLIGPNGSGKSTLVDIIAGRLRPESGTVLVHGQRLERSGPVERVGQGLRRTFQTAVLARELACRDNVLVGLYSRVPRIALRSPVWPLLPSARRDLGRMAALAWRAMAGVGAERWAASRVADVPHGVEQLTQLAAVCAAGPRTIILDEPAAGLSSSEVDHVAEILSRLRAEGVTVILIEHQTRFVFALCDEVTVLNAGEVVASGPADEVRGNRLVREVYLGQ